MKVIIAGSRGIKDPSVIAKAVKDSGFDVTEVVSGTARGVDLLGELWAFEHKVAVHRFPADWNKFGRHAGYVRNFSMAVYADALIAIWDGKSPGTKMMIDIAKKKRMPTFVSMA